METNIPPPLSCGCKPEGCLDAARPEQLDPEPGGNQDPSGHLASQSQPGTQEASLRFHSGRLTPHLINVQETEKQVHRACTAPAPPNVT